MKLYYNPEDPKKDPNTKEVVHTLQGDNVREETKDQRAKLKNKPFKEKVKYYVGYYKYHVLGFGLAAFVFISLLVAFITHKDYTFFGMMVNSYNMDSEILMKDFQDYIISEIESNPEKYPEVKVDDLNTFIDTDSQSSRVGNGDFDASTDTRITTMLTTSDLDILIFDSISFRRKAMNNMFLDLSTIMTEEELSKFEGKIYYLDYAEYEEMLRLEEQGYSRNEDTTVPETLDGMYEELAAHIDPSTMKKPIPIGIVIDESEMVKKTECYYGNIPIFAIAGNTRRTDYCLLFLRYMYDSNVDFNSMRSLF